MGSRLKRVIANLQGGIGNQLFTLFASYHISLHHHANLTLDKTLIAGSNSKHPDCIEELEIRFGNNLLTFKVKRFNKLQFCSTIERALYKLIYPRMRSGKILNHYRSRVFGFDPHILSIRPSVELTGYFQTYRYVDEIVTKFGSISIKQLDPSLWFRSLESQIVNSGNSVAIHVRRGDYQDHKGTLGMLSDEYFLNALSRAENFFKIDKVFIFSDSIPSANLLKSKITNLDCTVVVPPEGNFPTESLLLMSMCQIRIISNSTFSWWSGYLGLQQEKVIAPSPWYRNHEEPEFLIPHKWIREDAIWVY